MKRALLFAVTAVFLSCSLSYAYKDHTGNNLRLLAPGRIAAGGELSRPDFGEPVLVTHLPPQLPQRISGFTYDGRKLWAMIYQGRGRYATLSPSTLEWTVSTSEEQHKVIREVSGDFQAPGGISFVDGKLWVAGSYAGSLACIDVQGWKAARLFKGKYRQEDKASQMFSGMAFDGKYLWIAWHWFRYDLPASQTQLLLKIDPETGEVVGKFPVPPGAASDGVHGLAWDGTKLWHMKDSKLSAIDPADGSIIAQYVFEQIERPSGLAWDGQTLWIAEFDGKIWRLDFWAYA
ncbi:MAG TPA: hypothetical protein VJT09_04840 [Pyrinomonadaceae bacterium]|nr:hypothetical protein [Pyrinomonadaceae bacterium]